MSRYRQPTRTAQNQFNELYQTRASDAKLKTQTGRAEHKREEPSASTKHNHPTYAIYKYKMPISNALSTSTKSHKIQTQTARASNEHTQPTQAQAPNINIKHKFSEANTSSKHAARINATWCRHRSFHRRANFW